MKTRWVAMARASASLAINGGPPVRRERLPLHKPWYGSEELSAVAECLRTGKIGGDGPKGRDLERELQTFFGAARVLLTTSCTSALEIAMLAAGLGPDDEVLMPSFTFVTTASAVLRAGARPVFVDIDPKTFNMDIAALRSAISARTRAIVPVHYAGMACRMQDIISIAEHHDLLVIEDAAHAMNAHYMGRPLGSWGTMGCLSFHETKDMTCGEGGALIIRDNELFIHVAEVAREKGTDRSAFLRGERDRYSWVGLGSSYVLADVLAALALEQLRKLDEITRRKTEHAHALLEALAPYRSALQLPAVPDGCRPNWHLFAVLADPARRDWILRALRAEGIDAAFHYVPLHSAPYATAHKDWPRVSLPVTDRVASSIVRLPLHAGMAAADVSDIAAAVDKILSALPGDD